MLNIETIVGSGDALLPSSGFWGFLLNHWIAVGIAVMIIGFLIDQVLFVVRYRPQDRWREAYYAFRRFLTARFGTKPAVESPVPEEHNPLEHSGMTERREEPERPQPVIHRAQQAPEQEETIYAAPQRESCAPQPQQAPQPVIRRGGAKYSPYPAPSAGPQDDDAPLVVRAAHIPPPVSAEPITQNGNERTE